MNRSLALYLLLFLSACGADNDEQPPIVEHMHQLAIKGVYAIVEDDFDTFRSISHSDFERSGFNQMVDILGGNIPTGKPDTAESRFFSTIEHGHIYQTTILLPFGPAKAEFEVQVRKLDGSLLLTSIEMETRPAD